MGSLSKKKVEHSSVKRQRHRPPALTVEDDDSCSEYIKRKRQVRIFSSSRIFTVSRILYYFALLGVVTQPNSHTYYFCWVIVYVSFPISLRSLIPSDANERIKMTLFITALHMSGCSIVCLIRAQAYNGFKLWYWRIHALVAFAFCLNFAHTALYAQSRALAMRRLWKVGTFWYFFIATFSVIDLCVWQKRNSSSFYWNIVLTFEGYIISFFCSNSKCKSWLWNLAATDSGIKQLDVINSTSFFFPCGAIVSEVNTKQDEKE